MASLLDHYYKWRQRKSYTAASGQKALILAWSHSSNTVLSLAGSLAGGLRANHIDVTILNLSDKHQKRQLGTFHRQFFSHVFLMGSVPLRHDCNGLPVFEYFEADIYFWVLDPIIYDLASTPKTAAYFARARQSTRLRCLFPDRSYMQFVESWIGERCIYFPFAGTFSPADESQNRNDISAQRQPKIAVLANIGQELNIHASRPLPEIIAELDPFGLDDRGKTRLAEHVMHDEAHANIAISVSNFMQIPPGEMYTPRIIGLLTALDASEKRRRRILILNSVRTARIDIIGTGWQNILGARPNISYSKTPVRHESLAALFANYKVLLDFSPNWDHGFNDRVITSIAAGCRVVTSRNAATAELGEAASLVATYPMVHPEPAAELQKALSAPPIDENMKSRLADAHSWSARLRHLLA